MDIMNLTEPSNPLPHEVPMTRRFVILFLMTALVLSVGGPNAHLLADEPVGSVIAERSAVPATQLLDRIGAFLRNPAVSVALVALAIIGMIFELKYPGASLPGGLAAVCFVLFFWAYSFTGGFTLLAILLFLLGLFFLALEVFVIPGIGFSGVAGAVLMFVGLLLVTLDHWPTDQEEWTNVGGTFGSLAIAIVLAIIGSLALTWSLPNLPFLNRMVLAPPEYGTTEEDVPYSGGAYALLGAMGVAATPLRPSGKAQFGAQFVDVIAEGDFVTPGTQVQVVEIDGSRIVVREV